MKLCNGYSEFERLVEDCVERYGKNLAWDECVSEAWSALYEARRTYGRFAGCCSLEAYAAHHIERRLKELRSERNHRIALESRISLDAPYYDSNESIRDHIPRKTNDCSNSVALWDYAWRLGPEKYAILHLLAFGYTREEIIPMRNMSREWYDALMEDLEHDFQKWLTI